MENLLKYLPSVKTLIGLAAFSLLIIYGFRDTFTSIAATGNNEALSIILYSLIFFFLCVLGLTGFQAISNKEIEAEKERKNIVRVKGSKKVKGKQKGKGGLLEVEYSEDIELEQDNNDTSPTIEVKKKV